MFDAAGQLLERGLADVTVLDVSAAGIAYAQHRLGRRSERAQWVVADVLAWWPSRRCRVWHDGAAFHFLTTDDARQRYLTTLAAATEPAAVAVISCFAPDGPTHCSGWRYAVTARLTDQVTVVGPPGSQPQMTPRLSSSVASTRSSHRA